MEQEIASKTEELTTLPLNSLEAFPSLTTSQKPQEEKQKDIRQESTSSFTPRVVSRIDMNVTKGSDGFTRIVPVIEFAQTKLKSTVEAIPCSPLNFLAAVNTIGKYGFYKILRSFKNEEISKPQIPSSPKKKILSDVEIAPIPKVQKIQEPKIKSVPLPKMIRKINYKILGALKVVVEKTTSSKNGFQAVKKSKQQSHINNKDELTLYPLWHIAATWMISQTKTVARKIWQAKAN
jgi:hypothetical protein